ncbi:hypothetical protein C0992_004560 [Termitomyces sp. T32_za158]|nr:hypothetical protein C0992_004560 [Termitomyces sp. T32_za158]
MKNKLRQYELSDAEWKMVEQLQNILKVLKHATLFFSRSTPNLASVIPAIDLIDKKLTATSLDPANLFALHASIGIAKKTLNCYYTKTHDSEVYRIAMILHPRHKTEYFKNNGWEPQWIATAKDIVQGVFDQNYQLEIEEGKASDTCGQSQLSKNMFDNLASMAPPKHSILRNELECYLSTDVEAVDNVIQ